LYRHNSTTGGEENFQQRKEDRYSFPNDDIQRFAEDQSGNIWMGGRYFGLTLYNKKQNKFFNYQYDVAREGTIADNHVNYVFIDRSGMVWLCTNKGVSVYNPLQQPFVQTFLPARDKDLAIYDFYKDEKNSLWVGTNEGLFVREAGNDSFQHRTISYRGHPLTVSRFFKDENNFYIGTNFSFFIYDPGNNTVSLLPNTAEDSVVYNIIDSRIVSITKDNIEGHPSLVVSPFGHYLAYYDLTEKRWVSRTDRVKNILERFNLRDNLFRKI